MILKISHFLFLETKDRDQILLNRIKMLVFRAFSCVQSFNLCLSLKILIMRNVIIIKLSG